MIVSCAFLLLQLIVCGYQIFKNKSSTPLGVNVMDYGVYDPENRLRGYLKWHTPPWAPLNFPIHGGKNFKVKHFGD